MFWEIFTVLLCPEGDRGGGEGGVWHTMGDYSVNLMNRLGQGSYGVVYEGKDKKTGKKVAIKQVKIKQEGQGEFLFLYFIAWVQGSSDLIIFCILCLGQVGRCQTPKRKRKNLEVLVFLWFHEWHLSKRFMEILMRKRMQAKKREWRMPFCHPTPRERKQHCMHIHAQKMTAAWVGSNDLSNESWGRLWSLEISTKVLCVLRKQRNGTSFFLVSKNTFLAVLLGLYANFLCNGMHNRLFFSSQRHLYNLRDIETQWWAQLV